MAERTEKEMLAALAGGAIVKAWPEPHPHFALILGLALVASCSQVTGPEAANGTDSTRAVTFTVIGTMDSCALVMYTVSDSTSVVIEDCQLPYQVIVEIPIDTPMHITAQKYDSAGGLTVCASVDKHVVGFDTALDGDIEAQWIEGI